MREEEIGKIERWKSTKKLNWRAQELMKIRLDTSKYYRMDFSMRYRLYYVSPSNFNVAYPGESINLCEEPCEDAYPFKGNMSFGRNIHFWREHIPSNRLGPLREHSLSKRRECSLKSPLNGPLRSVKYCLWKKHIPSRRTYPFEGNVSLLVKNIILGTKFI